MVASQAFPVVGQNRDLPLGPGSDSRSNVPQQVLVVRPQAALTCQTKSRAVTMQQGLKKQRVWLVGGRKILRGSHCPCAPSHVQQAAVLYALFDELAHLRGKTRQHKAVQIGIPAIRKNDVGIIEQCPELVDAGVCVADGPNWRGWLDVLRLQLEERLGFLLACTKVQDRHSLKGILVQADASKSHLWLGIIVCPASIQTLIAIGPLLHHLRLDMYAIAARLQLLVVQSKVFGEVGVRGIPEGVLHHRSINDKQNLQALERVALISD
mmetsp:Transcript_97427/g.231822  ORF Transcript_97427/g.231822 Transcript_97427/m.231822 type:complete len:267 (-) Transcript_97427:407-1207(-)